MNDSTNTLRKDGKRRRKEEKDKKKKEEPPRSKIGDGKKREQATLEKRIERKSSNFIDDLEDQILPDFKILPVLNSTYLL